MIVSDRIGHRLAIIDASGRWLRSIGGPGVGPVQFHHPRAVVVDRADRLWVLDHGNHRGQVLDLDGNLLWAFGSRTYLEPLRRGAAEAED